MAGSSVRSSRISASETSWAMNMVCAFRTRAGEWVWLGGRARAEGRGTRIGSRSAELPVVAGSIAGRAIASVLLGEPVGASRSGGRGRARSLAGEERARAVTASARRARDRSVRDHRASLLVRDALAPSPGHAPERVRRGLPAAGGQENRRAV